MIFAAGEVEKHITVTILQDNLPEPDESLEVILDSPKQGLTLGQPHKGIRKVIFINISNMNYFDIFISTLP